MKNKAIAVCVAPALNRLLQDTLEKHQMAVVSCVTIEAAQQFLSEADYCLIVYDMYSLPSDYALKNVKHMRRMTDAPLLVVAPIEIADKLLEAGADICVPDHIAPNTVVAHALALIRRYSLYDLYDKIQTDRRSLQRGDIFIDPRRYIVSICDRPVKLRLREFLLLHYFMRNPQFVLTPGQICAGAWGMEDGCGRDVSGPIAILRQAIEPNPQKPVYIETVYQVGYRFTAIFNEKCDN